MSPAHRRTHCLRGHERTPENVRKDGTCRTCARQIDREYQRKRRNPMAAYCKHGHERTPDNVMADRTCRTCKRIRSSRVRAGRKTTPAPKPERLAHLEAARIEYHRRGLTHYIQRRRQRLTRQKLAA